MEKGSKVSHSTERLVIVPSSPLGIIDVSLAPSPPPLSASTSRKLTLNVIFFAGECLVLIRSLRVAGDMALEADYDSCESRRNMSFSSLFIEVGWSGLLMWFDCCLRRGLTGRQCRQGLRLGGGRRRRLSWEFAIQSPLPISSRWLGLEHGYDIYP